ncbi:MAG: GrpB family protein [Candidatus Hydrogenedentes bacterium]|nr:GrpB family protein [Candidatus Hydrogenedentota bacterium]
MHWRRKRKARLPARVSRASRRSNPRAQEARALPDNSPWNDVLIGGVEKRDVVVVEYDPAWAVRFDEHAARIRGALGETALLVEHIGSTAVPGLAAKPIIDILVVVRDSSDEASYLPALERAGYQLRVREPNFYEHRMVRTPERDVHVHVFSEGCPEIERHLIFRDRLRISPADRKRYQDTKLALAAQSWPDMNEYAQAKTEVIERIIAAARGE